MKFLGGRDVDPHTPIASVLPSIQRKAGRSLGIRPFIIADRGRALVAFGTRVERHELVFEEIELLIGFRKQSLEFVFLSMGGVGVIQNPNRIYSVLTKNPQ